MDLKTFNMAVLVELDRYKQKLKHQSTGSEWHPTVRYALLTFVKADLKVFGLEEAVEKYRGFIGWTIPKPVALPPSPTLGLQVNLAGDVIGGRQLKLC
jgi:hypothetical protein